MRCGVSQPDELRRRPGSVVREEEEEEEEEAAAYKTKIVRQKAIWLGLAGGVAGVDWRASAGVGLCGEVGLCVRKFHLGFGAIGGLFGGVDGGL